jgi:hypothetical protein
MYSLIQPGVASDIMNRMVQLSPDAKPQWGKMNVSQMLAHCQAPLLVALGEKQMKSNMVGSLFGSMIKKSMLADKPFKKSLPTDPGFIIKDERNFARELHQLQTLLLRFARSGGSIIVAKKHSMFGQMTPDEWGILFWKHFDHHFRQFGV